MPATRPGAHLGRYVDPLPIRSQGAFQLVSAKREEDGQPCVLVLPGAQANPALVRSALEELARVHRLLEHPAIARVGKLHELDGRPCLELECAATLDGMEMLRLIAESGRKVPYPAADAFIRELRRALQAAHATIDPRTGKPVFLGRISLQNVLFEPSGRFVLLGFGRNVALERDNGTLAGEAVFFAASELGTGAEPSAMGDYVALLLFMRSFLSYVESLDPLGRIMRGDMRVADTELFKLLSWIELRVFAAPAALRAGMDEAIAAADRIREILGIVPDLEAFQAFAAELVQSAETGDGDAGDVLPPEPGTLRLGPSFDWVAGPDGHKHALGKASRLIVQALVERHRAGAAAPLTVAELIEIGWPGERPIAPAGANRVYVELNRLRRRGLRELLVKRAEGYALAPDTIVRDAVTPSLLRQLLGRR